MMLCLQISLSLSGEEAHHRPVRRLEGWTQPHLPAGGPLWSHLGMNTHTHKDAHTHTHTFACKCTH